MYNIHGFNFKNEKQITDLLMSEVNLCEKEQDILDRMIRKDLDIDQVYGELSRAFVAYYLEEDPVQDRIDYLLGWAWEDWEVYVVNKVLPDEVVHALMEAESVQEAREALEDYES